MTYVCRSVLLRMKNVSDKSCREHPNTHSKFTNVLFESRVVYEIMWKPTVEPDRPQTTIWRMRVACWMPKPTNTHSENVNTYCVSTARMLTPSRLNVKLEVHCLSSKIRCRRLEPQEQQRVLRGR